MGASGIPKQAEWVVQVLLVNTKFQRLRKRERRVSSARCEQEMPQNFHIATNHEKY